MERKLSNKVAVVSIQYPPTIGGLQAHVKGIVDIVQDLGHDVHVITSKFNPSMKIEGQVDTNVTQLPVIRWFKDSPIINPFKLFRALKNVNPDIVYVVYPFPLSLEVACFYAYANRKKLICTYINDVILEFPYSMIIKIYENTFWRICKYMIGAISVSSHEYGRNATGLKDWKKKFYEVPPPVFDTDFILTLEKKYDAKKRLGLDCYDKIVLFVGGLRKRLIYKRLDLLVKAWSEYILKSKINSVLLIIGDGELKDNYIKMASELGLISNKIIFKGYIPRLELIDCYLAGDVFVLPSQDNNEAFGITPVEAMLYGNAVIASDISGLRGSLRRDDNSCVSLTSPLKWEKIVEELKYWLPKTLDDYALRNNEYVQKYFSNDVIRGEIRKYMNADHEQ